MKDEILKQLADRLGVAVEVLWAALLKQAPIDATVTMWAGIALGIFTILTIIVFGVLLRTCDDCDKEPLAFFGVALPGLLLLICLIFWTCKVPMIIAGFHNPQYWALKQIIPSK